MPMMTPPRDPKDRAYHEDADEPAGLVGDEAVDVERETPAAPNVDIERPSTPSADDHPEFEEPKPARDAGLDA